MRSNYTEVWKDIKGYEGWYQVSNLGRVKSLSRVVPRSDGTFQPVQGRVMKLAWDGHYFHVMFYKHGTERMKLIHRLVLEVFSGSCPEGMEGCHKNGNPKDNRLSNLKWGTPKENQGHRRQHGTSILGRIGNSYKLNKAQIEELRLLRSQGVTITALAIRFGISQSGVHYNLNNERKRYSHGT